MGRRQMGLVVHTTKMTVGMIDKYIQKCRNLLYLWDQNQRLYKVGNMQKLVGKLARLGKGAPWIYKLISHLYTSFIFALKSNTKLLKKDQADSKNTSSK